MMSDKKNGIDIVSKLKKKTLSIFLNIILLIFSISCIFPLIWMFYSSLKVKRVFNADIIGLPKNPSFSNYVKILTNKDYHIYESILNSFRITIISVVLIVIFGFVVGYLLARINFLGNRLLYVALLMGMLIPIHSLLVPIYVVFNKTGLGNHWYTLLIPYVAFGLPIAIFLVEGYIKVIPSSLEEAAAIDGSSFHRTLFFIMFPICKPILTTIAIIQTFACWNEFSFALVLMKDQRLQTVPLAMTQFTGQFSSDYPKIMSAMIITMLPIVLFYFVFSKQIINGMISGAVKG
jgi:raffinose/stachyose/melibiose transport system permease protein